ncbi:PRC-barrel domain-containing protein [Streptomyces sp. NPDC006173]|uniref:PRC-barrel domain-containing protein n=1 Tax=Streptomyces sp. NPDC006173 TaxID=3155349 RepID=UPI0033F33BD3
MTTSSVVCPEPVMRLAELIGSRVTDSSGKEIGHVSDVRLVEERGPGSEPGTRLRVEGLVITSRRRARLLAYDHRPVQGPWSLTWLTRRAIRHAHWAPWSCVASHQRPPAIGESGTVQLATTIGELAPLAQAHEEWDR